LRSLHRPFPGQQGLLSVTAALVLSVLLGVTAAGCRAVGTVPVAAESAPMHTDVPAQLSPSAPATVLPDEVAAAAISEMEVAVVPMVGGHVAVAGTAPVDTINPWLAESAAGRALVPLVFESLARPSPDDGVLQPGLAASWRVSDDNRTVDITLNSKACWADGRVVTAEDVAYSLLAVGDPQLDSLYGSSLAGVESVSASVSDGSVTVTLADDGDCRLLTTLTQVPIVPAGWPLTRTLVFSGDEGVVWGSGPFVIREARDGSVVLERNAEYWGDTAYLESFSYRSYHSVESALKAAGSGAAQVVWMEPSDLISVDTERIGSVGRLETYPASETVFVAFNTEQGILANPQVRQALSLAVDRERLLARGVGGYGELMEGPLVPAHWAAVHTSSSPSYDPVRALDLLEGAGWMDSDGDGWLDRQGEPLVLPVRTNGENVLRTNVAMMVAADYRALGLRSEVELVPWQIFADDLLIHDYQTAVFGWPVELDPDQTPLWLSSESTVDEGLNITSVADAGIDNLLLDARNVPGCVVSERAKRYGELGAALIEVRPADFLLAPYAGLVVAPQVHGVVVGGFGGPFSSAAGWYVNDAG
jgi:peptide/nickel transport system substrate-binding protein